MPIDYFGGYNRGMENLSRAFISSREQSRADREETRRLREDERRNRLTTLQLETGQEQLEKLRDERRKNREIEADIQGIPTTKKTMISAGGPEETEDWGVTTQETPISPQELAQQRMGVYLKHRRPVEAGQEQNIVAGQQTVGIQQETAQRAQRKEITDAINSAFKASGYDINRTKAMLKMRLASNPVPGITTEMIDHIQNILPSGEIDIKTKEGIVAVLLPDGSTKIMAQPKTTEPKLITGEDPVTGKPIRILDKPGAIPREKPETSHNVTEIPSPDGKTAQKMQYNPQTQKYDIPVGERYATKSQVININTALKEAEGFATWTPEAKEQAFMFNAISGEPPVSTRGFAGTDRQKYAKGFSQWQLDKGLRPGDLALMRADYKAGDVSLKNMSKQEAPMSAFVGNINKQIARVQQLYDNNDRIGIRLIDLPVREIKMRAKGSGDEAVKASYLLEISNEIGKLSSGASASVQQLSDSAKEDWKKVHDPNLSFKEIMKVVNATRDQANMRMQTWRDAKEEVRTQLRGMGVTGQNVGESPGGRPTLPKIGDVVKGYKFKGGNPADKNSWEKQ